MQSSYLLNKCKKKSFDDSSWDEPKQPKKKQKNKPDFTQQRRNKREEYGY